MVRDQIAYPGELSTSRTDLLLLAIRFADEVPKPRISLITISNDAGILLDDFYKWNTEVGTDFHGLWLSYYVWVGV